LTRLVAKITFKTGFEYPGNYSWLYPVPKTGISYVHQIKGPALRKSLICWWERRHLPRPCLLYQM